MRLLFATASRWTAGLRHPVAFVFVVLLLLPGVLPASEVVRHTLSFPDTGEQLFLVRSEFPVSDAMTELLMPNWTPGSYRLREYAANVYRVSAISSDGTALGLQKIAKDRWQVSTGDARTLVVEYEVFTPALNVSTSWASREYSLINGPSVFLYTEETRHLPQSLEMIVDADRGDVFTAMPAMPGGGDMGGMY